ALPKACHCPSTGLPILRPAPDATVTKRTCRLIVVTCGLAKLAPILGTANHALRGRIDTLGRVARRGLAFLASASARRTVRRWGAGIPRQLVRRIHSHHGSQG